MTHRSSKNRAFGFCRFPIHRVALKTKDLQRPDLDSTWTPLFGSGGAIKWTPRVAFDVCTKRTHNRVVAFEWDEESKAGLNFRKHGVRIPEAIPVRTMKDRCNFSKGKRGRVLPPEPEPEGKTRITIRLDQDIVDRFFQMAEESGGAAGYQTLINAALREYLDGKAPRFEDTLRRIIREELKSSAA
jgi:uncharacterized protein (DUF4415 family)